MKNKIKDDDMQSATSERVYYKYSDLQMGFEADGEFAVFEKGTYVAAEPNTFRPEVKDHIFLVDGKEHVLNACGHLTWQMTKVKLGDIVTPIYKGKKELTEGKMKGKSAHQWEVKFKAMNATPSAREVPEDSIPF